VTTRELTRRRRRADERESKRLHRDLRRAMGEDYWHGASNGRREGSVLAIERDGILYHRNPAGQLAAVRRSDCQLGYIEQDGEIAWTGRRLVTLSMSMN
jgi:hypothetical protein